MDQLLETPEDLNPLANFLLRDDNVVNLTRIKKRPPEHITIHVKCTYEDPQHPGQMIRRIGSISCDASDKVNKVVTDFLDTYKDIPSNKTYYLGYNQLLFREGTIKECGITHGKSVELYAPGKNASSYHNEGLAIIAWSLIPLVFGIASLLYSFTSSSEIDCDYQAMFLFLGLLLTIPSILCLTLGLILIPGCPMPCYFNGTEWC